MTPEEINAKILASLDTIEKKQGKIAELETQLGKSQTAQAELATTIAEVQKQVLEVRRLGIEARTNAGGSARSGEVSRQCARMLGALALAGCLRQNTAVDEDRKGAMQRSMESILGKDLTRTALSSSDIPLPVEYSGEVVELVAQYGVGRQYATVYPLGAGSVKLPKLKTSPAFGRLAIATAIAEKSPQTEWVTFAPDKFGGLIRIPTEIDDDSIVALGQFVARYAAREMAKVEDTLVFLGDATGGFTEIEGLDDEVVDDSNVVQMATGTTNNAAVSLANLRAMRALVASPALAMGAYYFHPSFEQRFSALNASGDKPYEANAARGATLDGFPIRWCDVLPPYSASADAAAVFGYFGDLSYRYLGVRGGFRFDTSREAAFATDEVLIRAVERLDARTMADDAISGVQTGAASS